jgi:uncharacterized protein with FMN-binding domain
MKKGYKALIIIAAAIAVLVVACVIAVSVMNKNLEALNNVEVKDVVLSAVADGTYDGSSGAFPVMAEVRVTVSDHVITDIELVSHSHGPEHGADAITDEVVKAQSLDVDGVSGATYSSKVILLAIDDALVNRREE